MHELHLVGFTADHDGLIFSTKKGATSGAYVVGIDDALFAALEEARRVALAETDDAAAQAAAERVRALRPAQRSNLSVRDIQSRLRSGMSLAEVAAEAGTDEDWVARFAAPVLAEQAAVVERAMEFTFTTPRKGPSSRPLGEAVRWSLRDKGVSVDTSPSAAGWSAFQLEPGQWAIRFTYTSRGRAQMAEWEIDLDAGELTSRNRLATELAYVEPGARRRKHVEAAPPPSSPRAAKKATSGRKGTPARTTTARAQAARASSTKAAAARAKATKTAPAERGKPSSGRGGAGAAPARRRTGSAAGPSGGRNAAEAATEVSAPEKPATEGLARFPAPRPAAGRPGHVPPSAGPERPRSPPAARASNPEPAARPAPPSVPVIRPQAPAPEPALRRVAAPPRSATGPTADARPMPTTLAPGRPGVPGPAGPGGIPRPQQPTAGGPEFEQSRPGGGTGDGGGEPLEHVGIAAEPGRPAPVVRRLPSPTAAASSRRAGREQGPPTLRSVPDLSAPAPEPAPAPAPEPEPPAPPRAPATVRPVGGGDGRPTILIIDADRAGDRRRS